MELTQPSFIACEHKGMLALSCIFLYYIWFFSHVCIDGCMKTIACCTWSVDAPELWQACHSSIVTDGVLCRRLIGFYRSVNSMLNQSFALCHRLPKSIKHVEKSIRTCSWWRTCDRTLCTKVEHGLSAWSGSIETVSDINSDFATSAEHVRLELMLIEYMQYIFCK